MTQIADPLRLRRGQPLSNRLVKSAMSERLADADGNPSESLVRLYERWGAGGAAMHLTGNVMIDRRHLGEAGNVRLDRSTDRSALRAWSAASRMARHNSALY